VGAGPKRAQVTGGNRNPRNLTVKPEVVACGDVRREIQVQPIHERARGASQRFGGGGRKTGTGSGAAREGVAGTKAPNAGKKNGGPGAGGGLRRNHEKNGNLRNGHSETIKGGKGEKAGAIDKRRTMASQPVGGGTLRREGGK